MSARELYDICCDMDYTDYTETIEDDMSFIQSVIDQYGAADALDKLLDMVGL